MKDVPAEVRVDYLIVVAAVEAQCADAEVSDAERARVLAIARTPDRAVIDASLARIKRDVGLRVRLLTDAITIAFADGRVAPGEGAVIEQLGCALEVAPA